MKANIHRSGGRYVFVIRQAGRQAGGRAGEQAGRQAGRQADKILLFMKIQNLVT